MIRRELRLSTTSARRRRHTRHWWLATDAHCGFKLPQKTNESRRDAAVAMFGNQARQRASPVLALPAVIIAAGVLSSCCGPGCPLLRAGPGFPPMRPTTAWEFTALGLALLCALARTRAFRLRGRLAVVAVASGRPRMILCDIESGIDLAGAAGCRSGTGAGSFRSLPKVAALALGSKHAGGALARSRFEAHRLAATLLASSPASCGSPCSSTFNGIDTRCSDRSARRAPATVPAASPPGSSCGSELLPVLRQPVRCGKHLASSGCAIVAPASCLYGGRRDFALPDAAPATFGKTGELQRPYLSAKLIATSWLRS